MKKKMYKRLIFFCACTCFIGGCSSLSLIQVLPFELIGNQKVPVSDVDIEFYEVSSGDPLKKMPLEKGQEEKNLFILRNFSADLSRRNNSFEVIISKNGHVTRKMNISGISFFMQFPKAKVPPYQILMEVEINRI